MTLETSICKAIFSYPALQPNDFAKHRRDHAAEERICLLACHCLLLCSILTFHSSTLVPPPMPWGPSTEESSTTGQQQGAALQPSFNKPLFGLFGLVFSCHSCPPCAHRRWIISASRRVVASGLPHLPDVFSLSDDLGCWLQQGRWQSAQWTDNSRASPCPAMG